MMGRLSVTQITIGILVLIALVVAAHATDNSPIMTAIKRLHGVR